jgi:D-alanine-D-alanine ligase
MVPPCWFPQNFPRSRPVVFRSLPFRLLGCAGLARVDFFVKDDDMFVNEVNTLPGFTSISMYPKLWEASGLSQTDLMDRLIAHAFARHARRRALSSE